MVPTTDDDDHDRVTSSAHIESATLHTGGRIEGGPGSAKVSSALSELVGDRFVVARIRRDDGRFSLIIDADWVELAESLVNSGQDLVEVGDLPRSMLLAVVAGWPEDWHCADGAVEVHVSDDDIPHLRSVASHVRSA